ncbi:pantoate--beta-alanine ligase [Deinococcus roseus]|uniref:Pantothenate synthetase n=1 Tax=Deinococcus roseus TaxID=392414 RepID=A0ABQ2CUS0_9DEIO|nr:pantoate--beta-alanine ligase [Deinococcus roseus]GGJ22603.1 pantothenate synthetase [Deinococcus roseus]
MQVIHTIQALRGHLKGKTSIGFVPTMGFLHQGHASLIRQARQDHETVVLSIFVNPTQFGPTEDFSSYPRNLEADLAVASEAGADVIFAPEVKEMYPQGFATSVEPAGAALPLEGEKRPGHFSGVTTVVLKLLNIVGAQSAYFGEKDFQQVAVVRQMVRDLNHPTRIVACPTLREASGLAMSSRNSYFTPGQKAQADVIYRALMASRAAHQQGERTAGGILEAGRVVLQSQEALKLEYFTLVDAATLQQIEQQVEVLGDSEYRLLVAARLFKVRLIDNMGLV